MKQKFLLLLVMTFSVKAQLVRPFIGIGYNRHAEFNNSSYYNLKTGMELNFKNYVKPEIEINYLFGGMGEEINYNNQNVAVDVFNKKISVLNIGFSPKIVLFKDDDEFYYFQILPKYNFSRIEAVGDYLLINQTVPTKSVRDKETLKATKQSFSVGLGIVFNFSKTKKSDTIALNCIYQNIDAGSLITMLNHNKEEINTKGVFAFEVVYYFNLAKSKK
jgi:sporulation protein YlmC with PRC-barrel domain